MSFFCFNTLHDSLPFTLKQKVEGWNLNYFLLPLICVSQCFVETEERWNLHLYNLWFIFFLGLKIYEEFYESPLTSSAPILMEQKAFVDLVLNNSL